MIHSGKNIEKLGDPINKSSSASRRESAQDVNVLGANEPKKCNQSKKLKWP